MFPHPVLCQLQPLAGKRLAKYIRYRFRSSFQSLTGLAFIGGGGAITQRRELYYSGHVQGVGFRYTAHHLAQNYDLTGFVRNLPDRRVHLVVEGRRGEIDLFLSDLRRELAGNIHHVDSDTLAPSGEYTSFEISY